MHTVKQLFVPTIRIIFCESPRLIDKGSDSLGSLVDWINENIWCIEIAAIFYIPKILLYGQAFNLWSMNA